MAYTRFWHQGRYNGKSESTLEHNMPTGPYQCLYQILPKCFKLEMCQYDTDAPAQGHPYQHAGILQKVEKRAISLIIIGRFYPKSNMTIFYDYIPVYKI